MATEDLGKVISLEAGGVVGQFVAVKLNSAGKVVQTTVDGEFYIGVAQMGGSSGDMIPVMVGAGITKFLAGETIAAGDTVGTLNNGRAGNKQFSNTGADLGDWVMGVALRGGANGEVIEVLHGVPRFRAALS